MGWLLFETAAGLKTEGGRILLPASVPMRARQFETACRALLLRAGIAIPVLPSMAINFETPGQWDGLVRLADGLFILESKACLKPLTNVPKLAKRAEEAKIAGFAGVIVVSLSGFSDSLNLPEACVSVRLSSVAQLSGSIPKDSFLMPTGDTLEPTGYGFKAKNGAVLLRNLTVRAKIGAAVLIADDDYLALKRALFYTQHGENAHLMDMPPFSAGKDEIGRLWEIEDLLRGIYSPPASVLNRIFRGDGRLELPSEPRRLKSNLLKILTSGGTPGMPETKAEARRRIREYPPFVLWAELSNGNMQQGIRRAKELYESYEPYAENLYNPNKARACIRYIDAVSVN